MNCHRTREQLVANEWDSMAAAVEAHLETCEECTRFAGRLHMAGELLGERQLDLVPDPGFASRVVAALPEPPQLLGWAALRVLPATLALALVLVGWTFWESQAPSMLVEEAPSDDLLTWVMESEEVTP